jgi:hypothetical protein
MQSALLPARQENRRILRPPGFVDYTGDGSYELVRRSFTIEERKYDDAFLEKIKNFGESHAKIVSAPNTRKGMLDELQTLEQQLLEEKAALRGLCSVLSIPYSHLLDQTLNAVLHSIAALNNSVVTSKEN